MKNVELRSFQKDGVRAICDNGGRALLSDEVGLGKTVQALYYAWRYLPEDVAGPIVVVCPSHLKIHWQREALKHLGMRVEILSGQRPVDKLPPLRPNHVFVINYDILTPPNWKSRTPIPKDSWLWYLLKLKPRLVVLDEGHYVKKRTTARTRGCKALCHQAPHALVLTGTPLANKPGDLWSILDMLRPGMFPSEFDFLARYTHLSKRRWGWMSRGAKNLDELHQLLTREVMIRRRKQDVLSQLPAVTYTVMETAVKMKEYRKAESDYIKWLAETSKEKADRATKAIEISRLNGLKQLAGWLKVDSVVASTEDLLESTDGKLLLGAVHHKVTDKLMDAFGRKAVLVDGDLNHREKQAAFDRFNLDDNCRILVGNLQAAGTGWSCTSTSNADICELPWVPAEVEQFAGRIHGIERGLPGTAAHVRFLIAKDTIESDLCQILQEKRTWASEAIDGEKHHGGLDLYEQVRGLIKQRHR